MTPKVQEVLTAQATHKKALPFLFHCFRGDARRKPRFLKKSFFKIHDVDFLYMRTAFSGGFLLACSSHRKG